MTDTGSTLRILVLTHYFPPEVGAPPARLFELAKRAVDAGHTVTVVTGFPNYPTGSVPPGYRGHVWMEEDIAGIRVIRTPIYATANRGFARRILNHLSFAVSSLTALGKRLGRVDVIFVESPPLFTGLAALAFNRLTSAPFIFNVSDIWPQSAVELGALRNPVAVHMAELLEKHLYRRAARITVVTPGMADRLASRGVAREKLGLISNGVDTSLFHPAEPDAELADELGLQDRKVFMYAGTIGMAQGLETVVEAARLTRNPSVLYVLVGEGAAKDSLIRKVEAEGIANVRFLASQPKSVMPRLLNLAYASIISLKRLDLFKAALPSKTFESMASARPIVAAVWGEAADLVAAAECGIVVPPEDAEAMRDAVERLASDPRHARELGERGRNYVTAHFERRLIANRFIGLLSESARGWNRMKRRETAS